MSGSATFKPAELASLPMDDLVRGWREQATTSLRDQTPGTHAFHMYFDRLAHHQPERAVFFIEAMLVQEPDDALIALMVESKLVGQLLHFHGPRVARSLQELALFARGSAGFSAASAGRSAAAGSRIKALNGGCSRSPIPRPTRVGRRATGKAARRTISRRSR